MLYIVTSLVTDGKSQTFSLLGATEDKQKAAEIATAVYKDYNQHASFQNIEVIKEWLATRLKHSFRRDKDHRLQLAITPLAAEVQPEDQRVIYSASREEDELMRRVSQALFEGQHTASREDGKPHSCPLD